MANMRDESQTAKSTATTTEPVGGTPEVQVYDNKQTRMTTPSTVPARNSGMNWGAVILGILIVLALVYLVIWYF
jgi:cobalamin biosynthesis Mg chelatase CobN